MKPIIIHSEMVKNLLRGAKTQLRIPVKQKGYIINGVPDWLIQEPGENGEIMFLVTETSTGEKTVKNIAPPYNPGDILYVRETWQHGICFYKDNDTSNPPEYFYEADDNVPQDCLTDDGLKWRASIHMPQEAARMFLKITDVRTERMQNISDEDLNKEGITADYYGKDVPLKRVYADIWDSDIKASAVKFYSWAANPVVWVYDFEVERREPEPEIGD